MRHVDRVLDAASNTFRVRLSLPNDGNKLPAGLRCKADLPLSAAAPTTAPATAPATAAPAHLAPVVNRVPSATAARAPL